MLACLRWPQETVDGDRIRSLARQPIRWPYLLEILHHHKVVPLFLRNLETFAPGYMPDEQAAALRAAGAANDETCLRRTAQLLLLNRLFREQQIDLRIFKGIPLAITAFQDPALRDAGDIDLLVAEKDLFKAGEILRSPRLRASRSAGAAHPAQAALLLSAPKGFFLRPSRVGRDHRSALAAFPEFVPARQCRPRPRLARTGCDLGSERIATLPAPRLLLYLCVHGALDGWLRLKWLTDIGALLHAMTPEQLASTVEHGEGTAGTTAIQRGCFSLPGSARPGIADALQHYRSISTATIETVAHILRFSKRLITSNQYRPIREQIPSTQWFLNEFRLHNSLRYRLDLILRSLFRPRVWRWLNLPDTLFPLYALHQSI